MIKRGYLLYNLPSVNEYVADKNNKKPIQVVVKDVILINDYKLKIIYNNGAAKNIELENDSIKNFEYVIEGNKIIIETNNNDKFEIPLDNINKIEKKATKFGRLYSVPTAKNPNLIGQGFRLPSIGDWETLIGVRDGAGVYSTEYLKYLSTNPDMWSVIPEEAANEHNFNIVAGGYSYYNTTRAFADLLTWGHYHTNSVTETNDVISLWFNTLSVSRGEHPAPAQYNSIRFCRDLTASEGTYNDGAILEPYTDFEGYKYEVRKIGNLAWMCENLMTEYYFDGTKLIANQEEYGVDEVRSYDDLASNVYSFRVVDKDVAKPILYEELFALWEAGDLSTGMQYLITDYQTTYLMPHTEEVIVCGVEPLLVTATSNRTIAPIAYSPRYPNDIIYYDIDSERMYGVGGGGSASGDSSGSGSGSGVLSELMQPGASKGYIFRRVDSLNKIDVGFDWRTVKFRRWGIAYEQIPIYNDTTTYYKGDLVRSYDGSAIYIAIKTGVFGYNGYGNSTNFRWLCGSNEFILYKPNDIKLTSFQTNTLNANTAIYKDYSFIPKSKDDGSLSNAIKNIYFGTNTSDIIYRSNTVIIKGSYNIKLGSDCYHNTIGVRGYESYDFELADNSKGNTVGHIRTLKSKSLLVDNFIEEINQSSIGTMTGNMVGTNFIDNNIGTGFQNNLIGEGFKGNIVGDYCESNTFGNSCYYNTFGNYCQYNMFGYTCNNNMFGYDCSNNTFGNNCYSNTFGNYCKSNTFGDSCYSNTFGDSCYSNTFGNDCQYNTFVNYCSSNTFGSLCEYNTLVVNCLYNMFGNNCYYNTFGNDCRNNFLGDYCNYNTYVNCCKNNTFGNYCIYNTFGDGCGFNNFYAGTSGTTKKDYIRYVVLEGGCRYNNFYSSITTSSINLLQRIRIKGLEFTTPTNTQITLSEVNTKYEWLVCYTSGGVLKQYCPEYSLINNYTYKIENTTVSSWTASTAYTKYQYEAVIPIQNIKESDSVEVIYSIPDADSNNYAPDGELYNGYIKIFAKVNTTLTIPALIITKIDL